MGVGAYVEGYVVAVDGVGDVPVPLAVAVVQVDFGYEAAVGDVGEVVGNGDGDVHALLGLVAPLVFAGPVDGAAVVFVGGEDPGTARGVGLEAHAAEAAFGDGVPVVGDARSRRSGICCRVAGKVDEEGAGVADELQRRVAQVMESTVRSSERSSWMRVASSSILKRTVFLPAMDFWTGSTRRSRW